MFEKRFQPMRVVDNVVMIYDSETDDVLKINDIANKLNEQQEHITHLEDTNDNFRIKLIEDIEAMEQAEKKIGEQQATINKLKEENEKLKNRLNNDL